MDIPFRYTWSAPNGETYKYTNMKSNQKFALIDIDLEKPEEDSSRYRLRSSAGTKATIMRHLKNAHNDWRWVHNSNNRGIAKIDFLVVSLTMQPRQSAVFQKNLVTSTGNWELDNYESLWNQADPDATEVVDTSKWTSEMWDRVKWGWNGRYQWEIASHYRDGQHNFVTSPLGHTYCDGCHMTKEKLGLPSVDESIEASITLTPAASDPVVAKS